jgi:HAD superfamily hydrolase (TIGR01509 family)
MTALVFDCDGVLAESERYGHLLAFNRAFAEFGLPIQWWEEEYGEKLQVSGGKERVATMLTPELVQATGLPADPEGQRRWLASFHERKSSIFRELVAGRLPPRPGVVRLVDAALAAGWALAVASTASDESVRVILDTVLGHRRAAAFTVLAGDVVAAKKPDPSIYLLALDRLGTTPEETVVIEDSGNGLRAATAAGLACVVTVSSFTQGDDFTRAALVVSGLGDPGEPMEVLANRSGATPNGCVELRDLEAVLAGAVGPGHGDQSGSTRRTR